ncbi:Ger(x)C family spore germination protein [Alicyclobacillus sendaiensis]|uniref:Ger(X)C family spore germination C-terminal domain-containing protein n=1 Tax=Alicyclobacillus sendaiensis PA2 TaxID=3029425 RepID=A0ABT6XW34_ALISE|nr:Ger(x)C family spore germination C-terminal domain-containing protein [Alicyclobacillus sendaiensis]MDI9259302.1 Ger(x)C family spore germination C-terminal domain-containing protein [Alicyclobacillus sendaiensis PA2]
MTIRRTRWLVAAQAAMLLVLASGCGDYQKINDRSQIIGIGVDPVPGKPDLLAFTLQVPDLELATQQSSSLGTGGRQGGESVPYKNFYVEATSVQSAVSRAQTMYDKAFFLGNLETVVFQTGLSERDLTRVTEQLMRDETIDKLAYVVATRDSARSVLEARTNAPPATAIEAMWYNGMPQRGYSAPEKLWQFWRDAELIGREPHVPLVEATDDSIRIEGTEVYFGYQPVGWLTPDDTVFYNFLMGQVRAISISIPDGNRSFDVRIVRSRAHLREVPTPQGMVLLDDIHVRANLNATETMAQRPLTNREVERYEDVVERYLQANCARVLRALQSVQADTLGFGYRYLIHHPERIYEIRDHWGEAFGRARIRVTVKCRISREGNLL